MYMYIPKGKGAKLKYPTVATLALWRGGGGATFPVFSRKSIFALDDYIPGS